MSNEEQYTGFGPDPLRDLTPKERLELAAKHREERRQRDLENLDRDRPIRGAFHQYLTDNGFNANAQGWPAPGCSYPSSLVQNLWHCFLHATLIERERTKNDQDQ